MGLLLCDLDDTLVSRRATFAGWAGDFLERLGAPASDLGWLVSIDMDGNRHREEFFRLIIDRYDLQDDTDTLLKAYQTEFHTSFRCQPEVLEALRRARAAGLKIAVVTNGGVLSQGEKIAAANLAEAMDTCCISEGEGFRKPDPQIFAIAAQRCGEELEGAWMVGDNPIADIGGAHACGVRSAWMRLGRTWPPELEYRPTIEVDAFPEAVEFILSEEANLTPVGRT
jgi:putative hydrolase of the HAD superfamily